MNLSNLFTMTGGLALFLYGMYLLGEGLAKTSGGRMEAILTKMTDNPIKGVLLGAGTTALIQSSSATTVMVVGFVNAGIMTLRQSVGNRPSASSWEPISEQPLPPGFSAFQDSKATISF